MADTTIDTYAATNPAMCSLIVRAFLEGYTGADAEGTPIALSILPLPIVLTARIAQTIDSTNVKTGLLPWIVKNQEITIGLWDRITKSVEYSQRALLFGIRYRVIGMNSVGRLIPLQTGLVKQPRFPASTEPGRAISYARRLGVWMGEVKEMNTIFIGLGVNR